MVVEAISDGAVVAPGAVAALPPNVKVACAGVNHTYAGEVIVDGGVVAVATVFVIANVVVDPFGPGLFFVNIVEAITFATVLTDASAAVNVADANELLMAAEVAVAAVSVDAVPAATGNAVSAA